MEHDALKNEDPRFHAIDALVSGSGVVLLVGTVRLLGSMKPPLDFGIPSLPALALGHAKRCHADVRKIVAAMEVEPTPGSQGGVTPKNYRVFFDLMEMKIVEVVMAFTAIEGFANEMIPVGFTYTATPKSGVAKEYGKLEIERFVSLDEKLSSILPKIAGVNSPKGTKIWQRFKELKTLRDRLVHAKTEDRAHRGPDDKSLWEDLLRKATFDYSIEAHAIIGYYLPKGERRWHRLFPEKYP